MKTFPLACALMASSLMAFAEEGYAPSFNVGTHTIYRPDLVPQWSGAEPGVWTQDYESALAAAKADRKYTLMVFMGTWWCPHCQPLEEYVFASPEFQAYVAAEGYYLTLLDFPYRDGVSEWTWLWDPEYRTANGIGDWTPQQIAEEYIRRFEFQDSMSRGGALTVNTNVLVQIEAADGVTTTNLVPYAENPTTSYHRVGYPTIIVIDPKGEEAGRFSFSKTIDRSSAVSYMIENIDLIKMKGGSELFDDPTEGGLLGAVATTYSGWLLDGDDTVAGTVTVKAGKANKKTGVIKVSATVVPKAGKKATYSGTATASTNAVVTLTKKGFTSQVSVILGAKGLVGTYEDGATSCRIQGALNVFKAKDVDSKTRSAAVRQGFWPFVLTTQDAGGGRFAPGYSGLSATVGSKGKVKVTGTLGDGTKVNCSALAVVGDDGAVCVPVVASLYSKKGGFSLLLSFADGRLASISSVSAWKAVAKPETFTAAWSESIQRSAAPGAGTLTSGMTLNIEDFSDLEELNGCKIAYNPDSSEVYVSGKKWTGIKNVTDLSVTFAPKTGTFKGNMNVYVIDSKGKIKKVKGTLSGAVVNGAPYGTLVIKGVGSWAVTFGNGCGGGGGSDC